MIDPLNIFEYENYKAYLKDLVKRNKDMKAYKTYLAQGCGCERSYLSQVLNSKVHLTMDHAYNLSQKMTMNDSEREYWLKLVELGRTATLSYRKYLQGAIKVLREQHQDLKNFFENPPELPEKKELIYFSKWYMVAIHLLCGIYKSNQVENISSHLGVPAPLVENALNELVRLELLNLKKNIYSPSQQVIYVHKNSPLCDIHHLSWRQRAIDDIQRKTSDSLHMTAVHSLSLDDFNKIKTILLNSVQSAQNTTQNSKEEVLACLNIDYFHF